MTTIIEVTGPTKAGKDTLINKACKMLQDDGLKTAVVDTKSVKLAAELRALARSYKPRSMASILPHWLLRVEQGEIVRSLAISGEADVIICNRYIHDTMATDCGINGMPTDIINDVLRECPKPHLVILVRAPLYILRKRSLKVMRDYSQTLKDDRYARQLVGAYDKMAEQLSCTIIENWGKKPDEAAQEMHHLMKAGIDHIRAKYARPITRHA